MSLFRFQWAYSDAYVCVDIGSHWYNIKQRLNKLGIFSPPFLTLVYFSYVTVSAFKCLYLDKVSQLSPLIMVFVIKARFPYDHKHRTWSNFPQPKSLKVHPFFVDPRDDVFQKILQYKGITQIIKFNAARSWYCGQMTADEGLEDAVKYCEGIIWVSVNTHHLT